MHPNRDHNPYIASRHQLVEGGSLGANDTSKIYTSITNAAPHLPGQDVHRARARPAARVIFLLCGPIPTGFGYYRTGEGTEPLVGNNHPTAFICI